MNNSMTDEIQRILNDLSMLRRSMGDLRLEVELSKKDICGLQRIYDKTEKILSDYNESLTKLNHVIEMQEAESKRQKEKFIEKSEILKDGLDEVFNVVETYKDVDGENAKKLAKEINDRVTSLERNQWRFAGLAALLIVVISLFLEKTEVFGFIARGLG